MSSKIDAGIEVFTSDEEIIILFTPVKKDLTKYLQSEISTKVLLLEDPTKSQSYSAIPAVYVNPGTDADPQMTVTIPNQSMPIAGRWVIQFRLILVSGVTKHSGKIKIPVSGTVVDDDAPLQLETGEVLEIE